MSADPKARISLVPGFLTDNAAWKRGMAAWAAEANQGHISNVGTVSLVSGTVSTVLTDMRLGAFSFVGFMPTTANAAGALSTLYVSSQSAGAATLTHASAITGDRTFTYCILG